MDLRFLITAVCSTFGCKECARWNHFMTLSLGPVIRRLVQLWSVVLANQTQRELLVLEMTTIINRLHTRKKQGNGYTAKYLIVFQQQVYIFCLSKITYYRSVNVKKVHVANVTLFLKTLLVTSNKYLHFLFLYMSNDTQQELIFSTRFTKCLDISHSTYLSESNQLILIKRRRSPIIMWCGSRYVMSMFIKGLYMKPYFRNRSSPKVLKYSGIQCLFRNLSMKCFGHAEWF